MAISEVSKEIAEHAPEKTAWHSNEMMTIAAARTLKDGMICFVGIGIPSTAAILAKATHAPNLVLIYESGTVNTDPQKLPLSIGDGELANRALTVVSMPEIFNYWLQPGRIDIGFLGAAQIDRFANINTTVIGESYENPKVRLPGAGGATEIVTYQGWPADRPHWGTTMRMRFPGLPQVRPRAVAVAGIAQPHRFLDALPGPFQVVASFTYPDHHPYTAQDALRWAQAAQQHHAQYLVTTEKDAVRMAQWAPAYHPLILITVGLEIEFFQPQDFLQWLQEKVRQREAGTR